MRILIISPPWISVPPKGYGGIELVVALLTEQLVKEGHKVVLFATGDSQTPAELRYVFEEAQTSRLGKLGMQIFESMHTSEAFKIADEFDIVHDHSGFLAVAFAHKLKTPLLHTLHGPFNETTTLFYTQFRDSCYYNAISEYQKSCLPTLKYVDTVYNAIDAKGFPFSNKKEDYLILVSRISALKGTHLAIKVAKELGEKLVLVGKINPGDQEYFDSYVKPHIDGKQIIFTGEIYEKEKRELLARAKCFVFPIQWPEPFGLVMAEAMACGTPVVAFRNGAAPEVIADGTTGYIVDTLEQMLDAVKKASKIDAAACREHVVSNFSPEVMANRYEENYKKIVEGDGSHFKST